MESSLGAGFLPQGEPGSWGRGSNRYLELDRELKSSFVSWTRSRDSTLELDSELESSLGLEFGAGIDPGKAGRAEREVIEHFWLIDPLDFHHIYYKSFLRSYLWL